MFIVPVYTDSSENRESSVEDEVHEKKGFLQTVKGMFAIEGGDVNSDVDISISRRQLFLKETSKRVVTLNNFLAIILVAVISFLIGFFR